MNDKLVQLHDGELDNDEATRMRASLTEAPADRALLDAMHRVDRTLVEVDRLIGPNEERIESGKEALKAVLRSRAADQQIGSARFAFRRPVFAVVGGALAAAAAIAIWVAWPAAGVIGTVRYDVPYNLEFGESTVPLQLGGLVRAPFEGEAALDVAGVFQMELSRGGEVRIGRSASDLHWLSGQIRLEALAEVTVRVGAGPIVVVTHPQSTVKLGTSDGDLVVAQKRGTSVVVSGDQRQTVEAGATVRIDLARSSLIEPDGPKQ